MDQMGYSSEESALYFELISGGNDEITVYQFLSLRSVLEYNFTFSNENSTYDHLARTISSMIPKDYEVIIPPEYCSIIQSRIKKINFDRTQMTLCCIEILLLVSGFHRLKLFTIKTTPFISPLSIGALILGPSMLPVMKNYVKYIKPVPLTFESMEFLLDINPFHVVYMVVVLKVLVDALFGLMGVSNDYNTLNIEAGLAISLGLLAHAVVQLVWRDGNLAQLILKDLKTNDYVQVCTFFSVFVDIIVPTLGLTGLMDVAFSRGVVWLVRAYSCLRIFRFKDTKQYIKCCKEALNGVTINLPNTIWTNIDKYYLAFNELVNPVPAEFTGKAGGDKKDKKKKDKDKKDADKNNEGDKKDNEKEKKKKKKDKKKAFMPMDIPLRLRLALVAFDTLLLITDLHDCSLLPIFPFSTLTFCRIVCLLYIMDTFVLLREKNGKILDLFPSEMTISTIWLCGKYYLYVASLLQLTGLAYIPGIDILTSPRVLLIARLVRTLRVIQLNKELETFLKASTGVTFLFIQQMMFAFVSVYMFAMLGNLLFGAHCENFEDPLAATVTCQRLFLPADFIDVTEDTMSKTSVLSIVFFVVYFFVSLVICNIALSIVIEWYADCLNEDGKSAAEREELAKEKTVEAILERARHRSVMRSIGFMKTGSKRKLHFEGLKCTRNVDNDHRAKLVGPLSLTQKDLEDCQKQSPLDLVKGFKEYQIAAQSKDEGAVVANFVDAGAGTVQKLEESEVLIKAGDAAEKCFLLIKGQVRVELMNGSRHTLKPLCLLGYEVLQPNATYNYSWVTETPVEVLILEQTEILEDLDQDLCGSLLRLSFKTKDMITSAVETDAKNKANRRRSLGMNEHHDAVSSAPLESLTRTPILVSSDKTDLHEIACKILTSLGCNTLVAKPDTDHISGHVRAHKLSAALTELENVHIDDMRTAVCGKLTLSMPSRDNPSVHLESFSEESMRKRILVVDDVSLCRKIAERIIKTIGFEIETAENGQVACDKLKENVDAYCAVLLDIRMPVMDGFTTLQLIREKMKSDIRVFFTTGEYESQETIDAATKYNAQAIIAKPLEVSSILSEFMKCGILSPMSP